MTYVVDLSFNDQSRDDDQQSLRTARSRSVVKRGH